jgi:hypothetical protein
LNKTSPHKTQNSTHLQRDTVPISQKKKKKQNKSKKTSPVTTAANTIIVHFNIDLRGFTSASHYIKKIVKEYPNKQIIINFVETGLNEHSAAKLSDFCASLNLSCSHVIVIPEESNLILQKRNEKKNKLETTSQQPKRGGISTIWSAPLQNPKLTQDPSKHWQILDFTNNNEKLRIIALYNNNKTPMSDHSYDDRTGNQIIDQDIIPKIEKHHTIILSDTNQTEDYKINRIPNKNKHARTSINEIKLTNAVTHISTTPKFTYEKGSFKSVIGFIHLPKHYAAESRIHAAGLFPVNYQQELDNSPTTNTPLDLNEQVFAKYDPSSSHYPIYALVSLPTIPQDAAPIESQLETEIKPKQPKNEEEQTKFVELLNIRIKESPLLSQLIHDTTTLSKLATAYDHASKTAVQLEFLSKHQNIDIEHINNTFETMYVQTLIDGCGIKQKPVSKHQKTLQNPVVFTLKIVEARANIAIKNLKNTFPGAQSLGPFPSHSLNTLKKSIETMLETTKLPPLNRTNIPELSSTKTNRIPARNTRTHCGN